MRSRRRVHTDRLALVDEWRNLLIQHQIGRHLTCESQLRGVPVHWTERVFAKDSICTRYKVADSTFRVKCLSGPVARHW